jgi:glutamine synthetase
MPAVGGRSLVAHRYGFERCKEPTMDLEELRRAVADGTVHTVALAMVDPQARLVGKRFDARFFLDHVVEEGTEACAYLVCTDVEMSPASGFARTSWDAGYGDMLLEPDLATLRPLPWEPGSVLCLANAVELGSARPVAEAPRAVLAAQRARLAERGMAAMAATELEFRLFAIPLAEARARRFSALPTATAYNVDYALGATGHLERVVGRIRREMAAAGMVVESSKGECAPGQVEIAIRYAEALTKADEHVVFREGVRQIAAEEQMAATFMAKYDEREGSSCHVHVSLWDEEGRPLFAGSDSRWVPGASRLLDHAIGGLLATMGDLALLMAPNVNSYKRYAPGTFAPTAIAWGLDNRTCAIRVVGHGASLRLEHRLPGADVNPYLALAAIIAGMLVGIEEELDPGPPLVGNGYEAATARVPLDLAEALGRFRASPFAKAAFGEEIVAHYARLAELELEAFRAAVTDWERVRGFERL